MQKNMYKKHALFATSKLKADSNNIFDKLIVFGMNTSVRILNWSSYAFVIGLHTVIHTQTFRTLDGFDETITFGEDHDLTKRAIKKNIKPIVLPKPVVTMSLRRYRKYGRVKTVVTLVRTFIHETFIGPVSRESINYKMGGET